MSKKKLSKKQYSFSSKQVFIFATTFAVVGVVAVMQSLAAPGGKGGGGRKVANDPNGLSLTMVTDNNNNGLPNWSDQITFNIEQTATSEPHVDVVCSQNGSVVYSATTGYFDSYPWPWTQNPTLSSQTWVGGEASCSAKWYYFPGRKTVTGGTLLFEVGA